MDNNQNQAIMGALGYPVALPQSIVPVTNTKTQVQGVAYDPNKMKALLDALQAKRNKEIGTFEGIANALAGMPAQQNFKGAYGVDVVNPWVAFSDNAARAFGNAYSKRKDYEREQAEKEREDAIKAAQVAFEADKKAVTDIVENTNMKVNDTNAGGNTAYRFEPERINELKELNDKAGRWATQWGKGVSDILSSDQSKAYNEFEGKAKQYVQDQLKKIYGAQMTEAEGERFFKSMGLSPYLASDLRWKLVESALDDLARKNNTTIKPQNTAIDDFMKGTK